MLFKKIKNTKFMRFRNTESKLRKNASIVLATSLIFNQFVGVKGVFANNQNPRSATVHQQGAPMKLVETGDGKFYQTAMLNLNNNPNSLVYCLEHNKPNPGSAGAPYTKGGQLDDGVRYILDHNPSTGDAGVDYYIKSAAIKYYLNNAANQEVVYVMDNAVNYTNISNHVKNLVNEARSNANKGQSAIYMNPINQSFILNGDFYETEWFSVSTKGNLKSYRVELSGQPEGVQVINKNNEVVNSLQASDDKFKLRVHKDNISENYKVDIKLVANFEESSAVEYIPADSRLQRVVTKESRNVDITSGSANATLTAEGQIKVIKKDDEGNILKGAGFKLVKDGVDKTPVYYTDENGVINFENLLPGEYTLVEVEAPVGYVITEASKNINVSAGTTSTETIVNNTIKGKVEILKVDSEKKEDLPLKGAEFTIYNQEGEDVEVLTTNIDGYALSGDLKYGNYTMKETKAPEGYIMSDDVYDIEIREDKKTYEYKINNSVKKGGVKILKIDSEKKEEMPLEGAEFTIYDLQRNEVDKLVTDKNGSAESKDLRVGQYIMKETKSPEGYKLSDKIYKFEIKEDKKILNYTIKNEMIKGEVDFEKTDVSTGEVIEGAHIQIKGIDKTNKDINIEFVSSKHGNKFKVPYGKYEIRETIAPEGYILSEEVGTFEIKEDGEIVKAELKNEMIKGEVDFEKTDVSTGDVIEGAHIQIKGIDKTNKDINIEFVSSKEGNKFKVPYGKYEIKETIAPEGYVLSEEVGTFEIKEDGEIVKAQLENRRIEGTLEFEKTDVSTGEVIEGAHIKIECVDGFDKGKVIEFVSTKEGNKFQLFAGKYEITETIAPKGYIKTEEVGRFEIKENGEIVKAELKNQRMHITTINPETGDIGIFTFTSIAIASASGLIAVNRRKKK